LIFIPVRHAAISLVHVMPKNCPKRRKSWRQAVNRAPFSYHFYTIISTTANSHQNPQPVATIWFCRLLRLGLGEFALELAKTNPPDHAAVRATLFGENSLTRRYHRRSIIAGLVGGALLTFDDWLASEALAQPSGPIRYTRYDVNSVNGQKMLATYSRAVAKMMAMSAQEPCSWTFQWYTHFVKGSTTKAAAISAIFGSNNSPQKTLARAMWDTCQAHMGPPQEELAFLPWHRMYVFYFESIVRNISGNPAFTLPYWNYSAPNSRALPAAFRRAPSPLFRRNRTTRPYNVNGGAQIPATAVDLTTVLAETTFGPIGAAQGFDATLDFGVHGNVHTWVGNNQGMGDIPYAAFDPIFWMHHCNIDRLWASWNQAGNANPTGPWLDEQFTFVNANCEQVMVKNSDVDQTGKLHYGYDQLEPVASGTPQTAANPRVWLESVGTGGAASAGGPIALGSGPTRVTLRMSDPSASIQTFGARMAALPAEAKVYLVLRDLTAAVQPGVLYNLYLDAPVGAHITPEDPHFLGTISFFAAAGMPAMPGGVPRTVSLNVTQRMRALAGQFSGSPTVTIAPAGQPHLAAKPVIGQIQFVEQ
jgi:tyrosinase